MTSLNTGLRISELEQTKRKENKMEGSGYSLADIGALMNNRNNDFFGGEGILLVLFLLIFGWGGNAWGRGSDPALQGALTRGDLFEGFNNQDTQRKLDGLANGLCDGFYAQNTTMLQGFNGLGNQIAENRFAAQKCCCETNRNIDAVRYENAKNTCDIITAANANTQRILDVMCHDRTQALRDKIVEKDQMLQAANFQLSQQAQSAKIINTLRPTPMPAYITCSPYESAFNHYGWNACGGCGY